MNWRDQAACASKDEPDAWHSDDPGTVAFALSVCRTCPVKNQCREFSLTLPPDYRVGSTWGGIHVDKPRRGATS